LVDTLKTLYYSDFYYEWVLNFFFLKILARIYFSITGTSIDKGWGGVEKERETFPALMQEMGAKTPGY
jgi:hypothetical protein